MPGMPQGRDINEAGPKSVTLVTIDDDRSVHVEERVTSIAEFVRVPVDATGIGDWSELANTLGAAVEAARRGAKSEHVVARVRLTGETTLAWRARNDADLLKTELGFRASGLENCWIEKIEVDCRPIATLTGSTADPRGELQRLITDAVLDSDGFNADAKAIAQELRDQLPAECRTILGADEASFNALLSGLARDGADDVLARLQSSPAVEDV